MLGEVAGVARGALEAHGTCVRAITKFSHNGKIGTVIQTEKRHVEKLKSSTGAGGASARSANDARR